MTDHDDRRADDDPERHLDGSSDGGFDRDDDGLRALLAENDPARALSPATPASFDALLRATMADTGVDVGDVTEGRDSARGVGRRRGPLTWLVAAAAAAVVVVAGVGAVARIGADGGSATVAGPRSTTSAAPDSRTGADPGAASTAPGTASTAPPAVPDQVSVLHAPAAALSSRCAAPNVAMLASTDTAFAATVTAIKGHRVSLSTSRVLHGAVAPSVTITSVDLGRLVQSVQFKVGSSYLISAVDGQLAVCGFSGPATDSLQSLYDQAFPR